MTSGTDTMDSKSSGTSKTGELKEQARVVGEDLKKLGNIARDATREGLAAARERAGETYGQVREKATQTYGQVRERGNEVGEALADHIRQHPWQSVTIAAGIGALLAVLMSRRR